MRAETEKLNASTIRIVTITDTLREQEKVYQQRIDVLNAEKREATNNLKKKETELYRQKFKIRDLQKTKQVLTHRTYEMKASLEPKEQSIETLKTNLSDLEKLFEMQTKALDNLR